MQSFRDILRQVFESIWAHRLRSLLTMFGIAWGVASLLLLIGLGEGFRSGQTRSLSEVGSDVIMMFGGTIPALPNQHEGMRPYKLTLGDEAAVKTDAPHIRAVTASLQRNDLKQASAFSSSSGAVYGVQANWPQVRHVPIGEGRFLDGEDERSNHMVVVLGKKNDETLFPAGQVTKSGAVGQWITINGYRFQVVGIAGTIARGNNNSDNQRLYIPLGVMQELFPLLGENLPKDAVTSLQYQPVTLESEAAAKAEMRRIVSARHGFEPVKDAFDEWDTIESQRMVGVIFTAMDVFLGGVGIVTLALGAVGIVNIMLVTVTERTKEIGLRKALGATNRSIMSQFFFEGLILTGVSGLIGIAGAAGLMATLGGVMGTAVQGFDPPRLVPWSAAVALLTLSGCGIVAGVYPARRAAMLEPVEALRKD